MSDALLQTKLYIPRQSFIPRPRLVDKLNDGRDGKLTLVLAPAGYGKTTAVVEWLAQQERPVAWLSLDMNDNDLRRFLAYIIATIQGIWPGFGEKTVPLLQEPGQALAGQSPTPLLTVMLNEMTPVPESFILVLDDYHVIESPAIDNAVTFLLNHQPPNLHLDMTSRAEPNLPLARLRAKGEMVTVDTRDLRFTTEETGCFLLKVMGVESVGKRCSGIAGSNRRVGGREWLRSVDVLLAMVDDWAEKLGVTVNRVQVRPMRQKWASMSSNGNLTLADDLLGMAAELVEYVIVHELLHLKILEHGRGFRAMLGAWLSDWEEREVGLIKIST